jgi:hypothetical protein
MMMTEGSATGDLRSANRWLGLAGIAGILFLLTFVVQFVVGPQSPDFNAKSSDIVSFYSQNESVIEFMALLVGCLAILNCVFLAGLWGVLRQTNVAWLATLGLVAGVSNSILLFVGYGINVALASSLSSSQGADAGVVAPLFKVASLLTMLFNAWTDGMAVLAFSVALLLSGSLLGRARWLAWAGVFSGVMFLVGGLAVFDPTGPMQLATLLGSLGWFIWLAGFSIRFIRDTRGHVDTMQVVARPARAS